MVMAFIPGCDQYVLRVFEVIHQMPQWYQYIIIGMFPVIDGTRGMPDKFLSSTLLTLK